MYVISVAITISKLKTNTLEIIHSKKEVFQSDVNHLPCITPHTTIVRNKSNANPYLPLISQTYCTIL